MSARVAVVLIEAATEEEARRQLAEILGDAAHSSLAIQLPWAAAAFSHDCPVGVDVEVVKPFPDMDGVALEMFPDDAAADYVSTPEPGHVAKFFYWKTRIEAALTARGVDEAEDPFEGVAVESSERAEGVALAVAAVADAITLEWR